MKIVATTSLPAVDRPNADRWNAARSRQLNSKCANSSVCLCGECDYLANCVHDFNIHIARMI